MMLAVSTGACYPFTRTKFRQLKILSSFRQVADGVEIMFPKPSDLTDFNPEGKAAKILKQFGFVSAHYPFDKFVKWSKIPEKKLVAKLVKLNKEIGLKHIVVHPLAVKKWENFKGLPFPVLLENEEGPGIKLGQTPKEMKGLLKKTGFKMCLDLNHAMSCGINPREFLQLKGKIKQVHVNTTHAFGKKAEHRFLAGSSPKAVAMVKPVLRKLRQVVWVIEPTSKGNPVRKIEREIALLRMF